MKRYVLEAGSDRLDEVLGAASSAGVSAICPGEVISALCRLRREASLEEGQYLDAKRSLLDDLAAMSVVGVTESVVGRAIDLLERWPVRASDSLHIASAIEWSADRFVSADRRQCAAALGQGLAVEELPGAS